MKNSKFILLFSLTLSFTLFSACGDDDVIPSRGTVSFTIDGVSKSFSTLNSFTIDDTEKTVALALADIEDELVFFSFPAPTSFPATLNRNDLVDGYLKGEDSYLAAYESVALTVTSYTNEVMTGTFSMTAYLVDNDLAVIDSVAITNGVFENIPSLSN